MNMTLFEYLVTLLFCLKFVLILIKYIVEKTKIIKAFKDSVILVLSFIFAMLLINTWYSEEI